MSSSTSSGNSYSCPLCNKEDFSYSDQFRLHLFQHFGYKKYPCDSCGKRFYSEEEREKHCKDKKHASSYEIAGNPYCEMLTNMVIKDCDLLRTHDMSALIAEKRTLNSDLETRLNSRSTPKSPRHKSPVNVSTKVKKSILKRTIAEVLSDSEKKEKIVKRERHRRRLSSSGQNIQSQDEENALTSPSAPAHIPTVFPQLLQASISANANVTCEVCQKEVDMHYVNRKDHVSKFHIGTKHSEDDYILILEAKMKKAFRNLTYCDLQCQECKLKFTSNSGRRKHVQTTHLRRHLECPLDNCQYSGFTMANIQKHLRTFHDLAEGYKSIEDMRVKDRFSQLSGEYARYVQDIYDKCFPCVIPVYYAEGKKAVASVSNSVITSLRERFAQEKRSGMPLRYESDSSESDEDSSLINKNRSEEPHLIKNVVEEIKDDIPIEFAIEDVKNIDLLPKDNSKPATEDQSQSETINIGKDQMKNRTASESNVTAIQETSTRDQSAYKSPMASKSSIQIPSSSSPWVVPPWQLNNLVKEEEGEEVTIIEIVNEPAFVNQSTSFHDTENSHLNNTRQDRQIAMHGGSAPFRPPYSIFPKSQ